MKSCFSVFRATAEPYEYYKINEEWCRVQSIQVNTCEIMKLNYTCQFPLYTSLKFPPPNLRSIVTSSILFQCANGAGILLLLPVLLLLPLLWLGLLGRDAVLF